MRQTVYALIAIGLLMLASVGLIQAQGGSSIAYRQLAQDTIINSDIWSDKPEILSAGYGFDNIIGVDGGEQEVRDAGGTWNTATCSNGQQPPRNVLTSSVTTQAVTNAFDHPAHFADGLPVVFSWPLLPSTLNNTDFRVTLNTGEVVTPTSASIYPNFEYNERQVAVIAGDFGNRGLPGEAGARYVTRVEIVDDGSPLMLLGPHGLVSAVGLSKDSNSTPYQSGPYLVGAKLNKFSDEGEGGPRFLSANLPNDGKALYGDEAQYRLRLFTSGGFSPDGVRGLRPNEYSSFFRIDTEGTDGKTVLLTQTGVDYTVAGGTIQVVGLADLGLPASTDKNGKPVVAYDDCYVEDHDNYIDIILKGDEAAMRHIKAVEIPATGNYHPFYNPGGPGNNPTPGVRYTAPGPAQTQPVIIALDDPMTVTYQK